MIVAKIYEKNGKLVLENCNQFIEKVLYPSGQFGDFMNFETKILDSKYIAISKEAKAMLITIFQKATHKNGCTSDLTISKLKNGKVLFGWYGSNKRTIDLDKIEQLEINIDKGIPDISLLDTFAIEDNEFLKNLTISQINWSNAYKACVCEK